MTDPLGALTGGAPVGDSLSGWSAAGALRYRPSLLMPGPRFSMSSSFRDLRRQAPAFPTYFSTAVMARLANEGLRLALILAAADTPAGLTLGGLLVAAFLIPS